jgi:hypothetical protein
MNILVNADRTSSGQLTITGATGVAVYTRILRLSQGNTTIGPSCKAFTCRYLYHENAVE